MEKKNYNRFFHLHTVSGIVISVGLYIIFFAGAFTLFLEAISDWEKGSFLDQNNQEVLSTNKLDYDRLLNSLAQNDYDLYGRSISLNLKGKETQNFTLSQSKDTISTKNATKEYDLVVDTNTYKITKQKEVDYSSIGDLFYYLHFYYQLGRFGYYTSGFVALFFLFAIVTGVVVHWKKIISNFYVFRPLAKLKTVWTDAHTVLGMIGLPFQFLYALTGAMFGLGILASLSSPLLYNGDTDKLDGVLYENHEVDLGTRTALNTHIINPLLDSLATKWPDFTPKYITINNCASTTMQFEVSGSISPKINFFNNGAIIYDVSTKKEVYSNSPYTSNYNDAVNDTMYSLHYADYGNLGVWGNIGLRIIYFIMALITCFVIITGVLIWLAARDKKNIPEKQRRFNEKVGHIYLAISLTMLPITAFSFIVSKLIPHDFLEYRKVILYWVFFGGWLLLSIFFTLKKNNYFINKYTLLSGGILGLCIPLVNGLSSGNWIWRTFLNQNYTVFIIDTLWIGIAIISIYTVYRLKKTNKSLF
tara:strand:- start:73 stop:1665 length:1593 start_codon:yes stop_codon:yes gene_type:complete